MFGVSSFFFFFTKFILSTVRTFIMFPKYFFLSKCCYFEFSINQIILKCVTLYTKILGLTTVFINTFNSGGSVVEHYVSSAKGCGLNSQGTHILPKNV